MELSIGNKIKTLRQEKDLTQEQLVHELNSKFQYPINIATLSLCENDKRIPSIEFIVCIAQYFECSTDYLLGLKVQEINWGEANINDIRYLIIKKFMNKIENMSVKHIIEFNEILNSY